MLSDVFPTLFPHGTFVLFRNFYFYFSYAAHLNKVLGGKTIYHTSLVWRHFLDTIIYNMREYIDLGNSY